MLFLMYWELNEGVSVADRLLAAEKLMTAKLFPPENIELVRFDITPDNWGITLVNAESIEELSNLNNMWRIACPGIFKTTKLSPARPVQESIGSTNALLQRLQSE